MPTARQKRVAKLIIENATLDKPLTGGQMLEKVSYSPGLQKQPSRILESEGVLEALDDFGFNETNAKRVVAELLLNDETNEHARLKAAGMVFEVHGSYAAKKTATLNVNVDGNNENANSTGVSALRDEFNKKAKELVINQIKSQ